MVSRSALVVSLTLALCACVAEVDESELGGAEEPVATTLSERSCPDDSTLTYEDMGGPFVYTWCNGCHSSDMPEGFRGGAPLGVDFDSLEGIRFHADRIWARSGDHNDTMPPVGGPDTDERTLFAEWLACDMPTATF